LKILRAGGGCDDVDKAVNLLHNYIDMIKTAPKYFINAFDVHDDAARDKLNEKVRKTFQSQINVMLPHRDRSNKRAYIS